MTSLQGFGPHGWPHELAEVLATAHAAGLGAIAVVPDHKALARLEAALAELLPADDYARLAADDGPTVRYRNFLRALHGHARIVIGTRAAAYAPVQHLGLVCCWDDGNDLLIEQRAPYAHTRDVLLLRAARAGTALMLASAARSPEAQRLVATGWAGAIEPPRALTRATVPRVVNTADSHELERDPLARAARLPHAAWRTARAGLQRGPVLVQVARAGYTPAIACQRCRHPARCRHCAGPLAQERADGPLTCRWCARHAGEWQCPTCGATALRRIGIGASRTAEELGRAFSQVPVRSSAGDHVLSEVPDTPALVVATVGAEPVAPSGYAAALLLDGDSMLSRESLRAGQETVRRWFNAASLVRPAREGGEVVVTAGQDPAVGALIRWDPAGYAERELTERAGLSLPPSVRTAALTGTRESLAQFLQRADLPEAVRVIGPAPVEPENPSLTGPVSTGPSSPAGSGEAGLSVSEPTGGGSAGVELAGTNPGADPGTGSGDGADDDIHRALLFFSYALGPEVTATLRSVRASAAAGKNSAPVRVRCDPVDVL